MGGFNLPEDFLDNPEALLRRARASLTPSRRNPPPIHQNPPPTNPVRSEIPTEPVFSEPPPIEPIHPSSIASTSFGASVKVIHDYSFPTISNVAVSPNILSGKEESVLRPALITIVQASPFHGKPFEDANAHLQNFLEICNTISIRGVPQNAIRL
jgi:hypothetical protein